MSGRGFNTITNQLDQIWFWFKEQLQCIACSNTNRKHHNALRINICDENASIFSIQALDESEIEPDSLNNLLSSKALRKQAKLHGIQFHIPSRLCLTKSQVLPLSAKPRIRQILSSGLMGNTTINVTDQNQYLTSWRAKQSKELPASKFVAVLYVLKRQLADKLLIAAKQGKIDLNVITTDDGNYGASLLNALISQ